MNPKTPRLVTMLVLLSSAGCAAGDTSPDAGPRRVDGGADAAVLEDGLRDDAALLDDAAVPDDAAMMPSDATMPIDAAIGDAGSPVELGALTDAAAMTCHLGDTPVCAGNVAGGTQSECTVTLVRLVTLCMDAGWTWTGDTICIPGGSPSSPSAFGGDGVCTR